MKITAIHHSADFDGIFCREIARKFLPDAELIGWDFGQPRIPLPTEGSCYVMDLPLDCLQDGELGGRVIWIDHHKSAIEKCAGTTLPGYRIDGVAACRLAWQWFLPNTTRNPMLPHEAGGLPSKQDFINRKVSEPWAVRLAGEYDIWDKRDPDAGQFQYGLMTVDLDGRVCTKDEESSGWWEALLSESALNYATNTLIIRGAIAQSYAQNMDSRLVTHRSFRVKWEGLDFLCLNTGQFNSLTFAALDKPATGHDALMGFRWDGKAWTVSLYHAAHKTDIDLSLIAVKHGGGGHRGACGFQVAKLPFLP